MSNDVRRTCGFVHTSPSASARLATVGSKAAETTYFRPRGRGDGREVVSATASVNGGRKVRLNDIPNVGKLLQVPSNPKEPKALTGSNQKVRSRLPHADLRHTNVMTAGAKTGAKSFVSSEQNMVNPSFRLMEAGSSQDGLLGCRVADAGKRKRHFCNGMDRSCNITPPCKRADFQQVMRDERTGKTFRGGNRK